MDLLRNYPAGYNVLPTENPQDVVNVRDFFYVDTDLPAR